MASKVEDKVVECLEGNKSFIIEAGAGSGKTWTLVQSILYLIKKNGDKFRKSNKKIACITYTNIAKEEIINRIQDSDLVDVKTIHDFLWGIIKPFQKEIKEKLINYIEDKLNKDIDEISKKKRTNTAVYKRLEDSINRKRDTINKLIEFEGKVQYKEYTSNKNGIISHDEVLHIANELIRSSKVIRKLVQDTYPIIFIDEYQDTHEEVAITLLEYLKPNTSIIFGLFGDYYQQIYGGSIGQIQDEKYELEVIHKRENYRCSVKVIDLLNNLRNDIKQEPTGKPKKGKCIFYYVNNTRIDTDLFVRDNILEDFNLKSSEQIQKLYLVTKSIAQKNGYLELHELYDEKKDNEHRRKKKKDQILKNKDNRDCPFANFLFSIEEIIELFQEGKIQQLLKKTPYELVNYKSKIELRTLLETLSHKSLTENIKDVFNFVIENNLLIMPRQMAIYFQKEEFQDLFFHSLMELDYLQFKNLYYTVKNESLFSTNHGTKGAEYDNVVCFIDDNDWKNYHVRNFLDETDLNSSRYIRTRNLFYVISSRARYNLAIVFLSDLSDLAKAKVIELFGEEHFNYQDYNLVEL